MSDLNKAKILDNNITFFETNLITLLKVRPKIKVTFKNTDREIIQYQLDGELCHDDDFSRYPENHQRLQAFNTAIILSCFSLFEASFETLLLTELDTKNLTGIQEKVMLKYIEDIRKVSSHNNYLKEYTFITGKRLKEFFSKEENELHAIIDKYYSLRHLLVHGSSTKNIIVNNGAFGQIELDTDDKEYQEFIEMVKEKLSIKVSSKRLSIEILLLINEVADLLAYAVLQISNKLCDNRKGKFKFIKENIFTEKKKKFKIVLHPT